MIFIFSVFLLHHSAINFSLILIIQYIKYSLSLINYTSFKMHSIIFIVVNFITLMNNLLYFLF